MEIFDNIRRPIKKTSIGKAIIHAVMILCIGLVTGIVIKFLDIYTTNLGNIFSQVSVWFFLCTWISIYSSTAMRAGVHVFCFCSGMLFTYYMTAEMTESVYSIAFVYGWTMFSLFSPVMGFVVWYAKGKSRISKMIGVCVILLTLVVTMVLYDKVRVFDIVFVSLTSFLLFRK